MTRILSFSNSGRPDRPHGSRLLVLFLGVFVGAVLSAKAEEVVHLREEPRWITGTVLVEDRSQSVKPYPFIPVSGAVVYLDSTMKIQLPPPDEPVKVKAVDGQLEPNHVCVVVGQKLIIEAQDERLYSFVVFAKGEPQFGEILPPDPRRFEKVFLKPHAYGFIGCSIDPQVSGSVTVPPYPIFCRTLKDGSFVIRHPLPPGKYRLVAFHPEHGRAFGEFTIQGDKIIAPVKMVLPVPKKKSEVGSNE